MITRSIPPLPESEPTLFDDAAARERQSDPNSVDRLSQLRDLRETLNHFSSMDASGVRTENDPADTVARRRTAQQAEHDLSFGYFARAYFGGAALRAEGVYAPNSPEYKESWTQFQYFKRKYESPRNEDIRNTYWKQLTNQIAVLEGSEPHYELPSLGRRAPNTASYPQELGEGSERELTLTTRQKLEVLQADKRAGFLPTTHREKTAALSLLNYMDTRNALFSTPHDKIDEQLSEIYQHQINETNKKYAVIKEAAKHDPAIEVMSPIQNAQQAQEIAIDSVRSVINEWDDSRSNAKYSLHELTMLLDLATENGSPTTTLAELLADSDLAIDPQPLLRYIDLHAFLIKGELPQFDPLRTREIRPAPPEYGSKNKIVTDVYLNVPDKAEHEAEFTAALKAINVKTLRQVLPAAIGDSLSRYTFFGRALRGVTGPYKTFAEQLTRQKAA